MNEDFAALASAIPPGIKFGTSTWTYPGWTGVVYHRPYQSRHRAAEMLREYAQFPLFGTVGIDSSFYGPLEEEALRRYAESLPPGFLCVSKAWERLTAHTFANPRAGAERGKPNPDFLNVELFLETIYEPMRRHFPVNCGPVVFEFQQISPAGPRAEEFAMAIDRFFERLPTDMMYAVEVRNPEFLVPAYFAVLREHDVAHVFNSWTRMPSIGEQLDLDDSFTAPFTVARVLLRPGRPFEEAIETFSPYDRILQVEPTVRDDVVRLITKATARNAGAFVVVNNRLEGNAPGTIEAIVKMLAAAAAA